MKHPKSQNLPFVSVVIPAHNEENFIANTLESLQNQDYRGTYEVIVVDNASTDNTAQIARDFNAKVIFQPQKGLRFTRERGFEAASGDLIASTDADITLPANWLSKLVKELQSDNDLVAVSGWFKLQNGPLIPKFIINNFSALGLIIYKEVFRKSLLLDPNFIVKKTAYFKSGGLSGLDSMNEDLLLAQRLGTVGKVKMHYGQDWAVVSSPRRWMDGFLPGSGRYLVNAISFGIFGKLVFKDFKDIRVEKASRLKLAIQFAYASAAIISIATFFLVNSSPARSKISPIQDKLAQQINRSLVDIQKFRQADLQLTFIR